MLIFKIINPKNRHMRNLILFVLAALFFSCGDKKEKIVEQIKGYKDSCRVILDSMVKLNVNETLKYEELYFTNGKPDHNKVGNIDLSKEYRNYQAMNDSIEWKLKVSESHFKQRIDSLELELKKY